MCCLTAYKLVLRFSSTSFKTIDRELIEILCICATAEAMNAFNIPPNISPNIDFAEHKLIISANIWITYHQIFDQMPWFPQILHELWNITCWFFAIAFTMKLCATHSFQFSCSVHFNHSPVSLKIITTASTVSTVPIKSYLCRSPISSLIFTQLKWGSEADKMTKIMMMTMMMMMMMTMTMMMMMLKMLMMTTMIKICCRQVWLRGTAAVSRTSF